MMPAPTPLRAVWLMTRMRLTRQRNQFVNIFNRKKKKARDGNAGKRGGLWIMTLLVAVIMVPAIVFMSRNAVLNMQCHLVAHSGCVHAGALGGAHAGARAGVHAGAQVSDPQRLRINPEQAARELRQAPFDPALRNGVTMLLSLGLAIAVLLPLGSAVHCRPEYQATMNKGGISASAPDGLLALRSSSRPHNSVERSTGSVTSHSRSQSGFASSLLPSGSSTAIASPSDNFPLRHGEAGRLGE